MAAITTPYSLEMTADEDARDIVAGTVVTLVNDHLKIFLGATVPPGKQQTIVGTLERCFRLLMNTNTRVATNADLVAYGDYASGIEQEITIEGITGNVGDDDVAVVMSDTFTASANTHMLEESFRQLVNKFLENAKDT